MPIPRTPLLLLAAVVAALGCRTAPTGPAPISDQTASESRRQSRPQFPVPERDQQSRNDQQPRRERSSRRHPHNQTSGAAAPGQFDFYLFNLSWSPAFCSTHQSPECASHPGFVVHGLWPQNDDGSYPESCSNAPGPANPQQYADLQPTASLLDHEWQTHGTCSGLAADAYFATTRQAFHEITIPASLRSVQTAQTVTPQSILDAFAQSNPKLPPAAFALSCGNNSLTAVEVCLTRSLAGEACPNVRSCRANVVRITPQ